MILFVSITIIIFKFNVFVNSNLITYNSRMFFNSFKLFIPIKPILLIFLKFRSILSVIKFSLSNIIKLIYILYLTIIVVIIVTEVIVVIVVIMVTAVITALKNSVITIRIIVATKISPLIIII